MPVQIPTLNRFQPTETPSVGRVDPQLPNIERGTNRTEQLANRLAQTGVDYAWHVEDQAMDTAAIKAENEYRSLHSQLMYGDGNNPGAIHMEGDPAPVYKSLEEKLNEARENILSGDMSDRTRSIVERRLSQREEQLRLSRDSQFSTQLNKYTEKTFAASQDLRIKDYTDAATLIEPENKSTFEQLDKRVHESIMQNNNHAVKVGLAIPDPNGDGWATTSDGTEYRVKLGPIAKRRQAEEVGKGLSDAMDNILKSNVPHALEKVQAIKDKYGDLIDPDVMAKIDKQVRGVGVDQTAFSIVGQAKSQADVKAMAEKIKDPATRAEVYHKALQVYNDNQSHQEMIANRNKKAVANTLMTHLLDVQKSSNPYGTITELENDSVFKATKEKMDAKDLAKAYNIIAPPKVSNDKVKQNMYDLMTSSDPNNNLATMDRVSYEAAAAGLSAKDKAFFDARRGEFTKPETGAQLHQRYSQAESELQKQLLANGVLKRDEYSKTLTKASQMKYDSLRNDYIEKLAKAGPGQMSPPDINQFAQNFATYVKTGEAFQTPDTPRFNGGRNAPAAPPIGNDIPAATQKINGQSLGYWVNKYKAANPGAPVSTATVKRWALEQ